MANDIPAWMLPLLAANQPRMAGPMDGLRPAPDTVPYPAPLPSRPPKIGILDRLFGGNIPVGLLSNEDKKSARKRALLMAGIATMGAGSQPGANLGGALATGLATGLQGGMAGYQQAFEGQQMQDALAKKQQVEQARNMIYQKYPPAPGETPVQMLQRYARMLPEFIRLGDTETVGKLTELLKSVGGEAFGVQKTNQTPHTITALDEQTGKPVIKQYDPNTGQWKTVADAVPPKEPRDPNTMTLAQKASTAVSLGRQYNTEMKDIFDTYRFMGGAGRDAELAIKGDVAAQTQLLYTFIKAMDPGSVVREGEIGLVKSAMPLWSQAQAWYQKSLQGVAGVLDPKTARQMLSLIKRRQKDYQTYAQDIRDAYIERGAEYGISEKTFRPLPTFVGESSTPGGNAAAVDSILRR